MARPLSPLARHGAALAAGLCAVAAIGFGARLDGFRHAQHPLALLGAQGMPLAGAFNLLAFVLPGGLVAWTAVRLRARLDAGVAASSGAGTGWSGRIGAQALALAGLAFAAQGLFPLDPDDLESAASGRHAAVWMLWWIASTLAAALLAIGLRRSTAWAPLAKSAALAAFALPLLALVLPQLLPAGLAQRLAFAAWFAWAIHAGRVAERIQP